MKCFICCIHAQTLPTIEGHILVKQCCVCPTRTVEVVEDVE